MYNIKDFTLETLENFCVQNGFAKYSAKQIFNWIYCKRVYDFDKMSNLSKKVRDFLKKEFCFSKMPTVEKQVSKDKTTKYLFELGDKEFIETVFIPEKKRATICLSTQVGCKFACSFCLSGKHGFVRNLTVSEIIDQVLAVLDDKKELTNIVFMGIGEPLDNFNNLIKAVSILKQKQGFNFTARKISISTCGVVPKIKQLAKLDLGIKLSISLHAANNALRDKIMPVNKKYRIEQLMEAVEYFSKKNKFDVTFEYVLLPKVNMSRFDINSIVKLFHGQRYKINLIKCNTSKSEQLNEDYYQNASDFQKSLINKGINATLRKSRGSDISAACGQLKGQKRGA